MNRNAKLLIVALLTLVLTACTTYYSHPSKPGHMFKSEEAQCTYESERNNCRQYGPSSQTSCNRNALTGGIDCFTDTTPGGTRCEADTQQVRNCLARKGWRVSDKDGKPK